MSRFKTLSRGLLILASALFSMSPRAHAARTAAAGGSSLLSGGSLHFGLLLGVSNSAQEHINTLITRANGRAGAGPISTGSLNSAYEGGLEFGYRFSGSIIEMLIRPTYFYEKANGSGTDGNYNYGVTGFTLFPLMRFYPLENDYMRFFMQLGLGYGHASSSIEEGANKVDASGDAFGTQFGLGAEFIITAVQSITLEGNYRYLTMERNIASSASGSFGGNSLSQAASNREVELDGDDLAVRMGGIQLLLGYMLHF